MSLLFLCKILYMKIVHKKTFKEIFGDLKLNRFIFNDSKLK
jgi:hypothetical protein